MIPEGNTILNPIRKAWMAPRGLRAWHVIKGNSVNVGDPNGPPKGESTNKQNKDVETAVKEVR